MFATAGSSARVAGPLLVTEVYEQLGSYWMLGIVAILMVIRLDVYMKHNEYLYSGSVLHCDSIGMEISCPSRKPRGRQKC